MPISPPALLASSINSATFASLPFQTRKEKFSQLSKNVTELSLLFF
jgi:hypothetical protein